MGILWVASKQRQKKLSKVHVIYCLDSITRIIVWSGQHSNKLIPCGPDKIATISCGSDKMWFDFMWSRQDSNNFFFYRWKFKTTINYTLFPKRNAGSWLRLHFFWGRVYISEPDKIDMTLCQGQWPRINRKNGWIKPVFLLGKSVV